MEPLLEYFCWEFAAYYPIWYECLSFLGMDGRRCYVEKATERLSAHGDGHEDAKDFWSDLRLLSEVLFKVCLQTSVNKRKAREGNHAEKHSHCLLPFNQWRG
jgi:hypothetical protein